MYPSDHIWKNVRTELHGYRAWPALTFISLFIITALAVSTLISNHPHQPIIIPVTSVIAQHEVATPVNAVTIPKQQHKNYFDQAASDQITAATFGRTEEETIIAEPVLAANILPEPLIAPTTLPAVETAKLVVNRSAGNTAGITAQQETVISSETADQFRVIPAVSTETINTGSETKPTVPQQLSGGNNNSTEELLKERRYNPTVMSRPNHRFGFQFYITPSTSYRKLSDEKLKEVQPALAANSITTGSNNADVNGVVRHRPAFGLEVGFAVLYKMSDRLRFMMGAQLNVRQYYIETFQSGTSDLSTLSLINYRGIENVSFYSPYNNNTGFRKTQLDNKVYQISIPVGIQWEMLRGKHFGVNAEASVQPTMTVNNQTYLLSTDLKHYADGDQFIRKWNVNTSVGLNLSYTSGRYSWQIGPQVRYQHLPTYSNAYPIKEHLMDYGVRIGFTKQLY